MDERERRLQQRRAKRRKNELIMKCLISLFLLILIVLAAVLTKDAIVPGIKGVMEARKEENGKTAGEAGEPEGDEGNGALLAGTEDVSGESEAPAGSQEELIAQADLMAAQYDYDGAIALLQSSSDYTGSQEMQEAVTGYQAVKETCTAYPIEQITHVFFHTMIVDDSKAFDGDDKQDGYNQVMTTMSEFTAMMESMYEKGYVMVSLHDMCTVNEDGTVSQGEILLPPGKTPFVLSQDDVSYYHYMDGDGFAQKLILDENGEVKNTYVEDDGSVSVGDYDMVPWIDTFVKEHPDFSYHGHKGILALTG